MNTKKILLSAGVILLGTAAFKIAEGVRDVNEIKKQLVASLIADDYYDSSRYDPASYPDTTISFKVDAKNPDKKSVLMKGGLYGIPSTYVFLNLVDQDNAYDYTAFNKSCVNTFGVPYYGTPVKMASFYTDDNGKKVYSNFTYYHKTGVEAIFKKLYIKPTDDFEGYSAKKLYDLVAKDYTRDFAKLLVYLLNTKKAVFTQVSADYLAKAKTDKNFHPNKVLPGYMKKLFPTEASSKAYPAFASYIYENYLGSLIRRQCDGTMPAIVNAVKTILKDYDPEGYKMINGKI